MPISIIVIITIIAGQILTASKVPVQLVIISYLFNDNQTCSPETLINLVIKWCKKKINIMDFIQHIFLITFCKIYSFIYLTEWNAVKAHA